MTRRLKDLDAEIRRPRDAETFHRSFSMNGPRAILASRAAAAFRLITITGTTTVVWKRGQPTFMLRRWYPFRALLLIVIWCPIIRASANRPASLIGILLFRSISN